ncbi:MAG: hypothetical protein ABI946_08950 [Chthoniobacterales bacterium]
MKTLCALFLTATLAWLGYSHYFAAITYPPGVLVASEPSQQDLPAETRPIAHGAYQLRCLAAFSLDSRVLHRKNYRYDREANLVPTDLALGWGAMSDQAVLDRVEISQSSRFYFYEYRNPPPIPQDEIGRQSANMHIIPADSAVGSVCRSLRAGELVRLEGKLVEATGPEIGTWRSSLRRNDTGRGACELFLVEKVTKSDPFAVRQRGEQAPGSR